MRRLAVRCQYLCFDRAGRPRDGDQWIHIYGSTRWVCAPCALGAWKATGIAGCKQTWAQSTLYEALLNDQLEQDGMTEAPESTQAPQPAVA